MLELEERLKIQETEIETPTESILNFKEDLGRGDTAEVMKRLSQSNRPVMTKSQFPISC